MAVCMTTTSYIFPTFAATVLSTSKYLKVSTDEKKMKSIHWSKTTFKSKIVFMEYGIVKLSDYSIDLMNLAFFFQIRF